MTVENIKDLGFTFQMFGLDNESSLELYIQDIIDDAGAILEGVIGSTTYNSASSPTAGYVKRAEKCLVASELLQRRINRVLNNVTASDDKISTRNEEQQMQRYQDEAEKLISLLTGDTDYSFGIVKTSHFEETSGPGGLEVSG
ncbi:MAG: hypothetical protein GXP46_01875 [Deferribacteres bacterium]|nr:hypothetical protein [Deferribacteres bacterium]